MQGQQSRQHTQWSPCGISAGKYWTLNKKSQEKKSIFIYFHYLNGPKVWHLYIHFFLITVITQQTHSSILHWIVLILALDNTLNLHIFEFSQFRPDLIAPINFGSRRTSPWSLQVSAALRRGPRWCRYSTEKCLLDSYLPFVYAIIIPPLQWSWKGGILVSPCPFVRPSVCPSVDRIMSALYLQQYSSDAFHICTSYQAS